MFISVSKFFQTVRDNRGKVLVGGQKGHINANLTNSPSSGLVSPFMNVGKREIATKKLSNSLTNSWSPRLFAGILSFSHKGIKASVFLKYLPFLSGYCMFEKQIFVCCLCWCVFWKIKRAIELQISDKLKIHLKETASISI